MDKLWLALAAGGAGILVALLGFLDSQEKFNLRKFCASVVRSLIAGVIWAAAYPINEPISWSVILAAVASGPFFDTIVNRVGTLLGNNKFPLPKEKPQSQPPKPPAGAAGATP
ncbi:MAG: hypothetical protein WC455_19755 [Dehalococcoidia bacterium]|jgi:hypothetical protein